MTQNVDIVAAVREHFPDPNAGTRDAEVAGHEAKVHRVTWGEITNCKWPERLASTAAKTRRSHTGTETMLKSAVFVLVGLYYGHVLIPTLQQC